MFHYVFMCVHCLEMAVLEMTYTYTILFCVLCFITFCKG